MAHVSSVHTGPIFVVVLVELTQALVMLVDDVVEVAAVKADIGAVDVDVDVNVLVDDAVDVLVKMDVPLVEVDALDEFDVEIFAGVDVDAAVLVLLVDVDVFEVLV